MIKLALTKKSPEAETQRSTSPRGGSLFSFWLSAFAGIALVFTVTVSVLGLLAYSQESRVRSAAVADQSRLLAERLSAALKRKRQLLQRLADAPGLPALLADDGARDQWERGLTPLLPEVLQVRLLPEGYDRPILDTDPPIGYAALALVRSAEQGKGPAPLEVHLAHTPQAHLAGAAGLDGGAGTVYVAWDVKPLRRWLKAIGPGNGRVALQQEVEGRFTTLYANGVDKGGGAPDAIHPLSAGPLRVVHWYGPGEGGEGVALPMVLVLLLALVASAALMWQQFRRLRRALDADQAVLVHLAEDVLAGRKPRRLGLKIRDFSYVQELLQQRLKNVREQRQETPKPAPSEESAVVPAEPAFTVTESPPPDDLFPELPAVIFRPYDIRGVVGAGLTAGVVREIGRAVGSEAYDQGQQAVAVARDARDSGVALSQALIAGINATGRDVIDLGVVPVPILYFATHFLGSNSGVMVTGSHNPPEYNGLKVVIGGESLAGPAIQALRERVEQGDLLEGSGACHAQDLIPDYIQRIAEDVSVPRPLKVVVDCGNGCTGLVAPKLYAALGCEVVELHCELQDEPAHHADPSRPENLEDLRREVEAQQADLGLAFDGDGDRLGVVDSRGHIIWPDRLLMLMAADVLSRHPGGDVIFDVKSTRFLTSQILQHGGRPVMWKSGHSLLKAKLRDTGALLAGEWTGHIIFRERWYGFDDALYAGARLMEILAMDPRDTADVFADYPEAISTPELFLTVEEGEQYELMDRIQQRSELLAGAKLTNIDGLRAEMEDSWGLVRASNTSPALTFRFEADSQEALAGIQDRFRQLLAAAAPDLEPPF